MSEMLKCFVCKGDFDETQTLFEHIKKSHKKSERYQCTEETCGGMIFSAFANFKKHVVRCFNKRKSNDDTNGHEQIIPVEMFAFAADEDVLQFKKNLDEAAVEFASSLSANMSAPQCEVYSIIRKLKKIYIAKLIEGIIKIQSKSVDSIHEIMKAVETSFDEVETESAFHAKLQDLNVYEPVTQCEIVKVVERKQKPRKRQKKNDQAEVHDADGKPVEANPRKRKYESDDEDAFDAENGNIRVEKKTDEYVILKGDVTIMPIKFQIQKFFEMPNVFEKIKLNTERIQEGKDLNHFIKGKLWKKKIEKYNPEDLVIPYHFYGDGAQINNPLGPHAKAGEMQFNYYTFPTAPTEFQSLLQNIFVAQAYQANYHKTFSNEEIYNNIVEIFRSLAEDGIVLEINGEKQKVFFVLGLFIGDNKEQNQRLGYVGSFVGLHCCRYCDMHIDDIRTKVSSAGANRRNRQNYDRDVITNNVSATGVKEYSVFNNIPNFHVTESSGVDLDHNLTEGSLHISIAHAVRHFIEKDYFDLEFLNDQISSLNFGKIEQGNKPTVITIKHVNRLKFKMSASEMFFFTHHFTLLVGSRVPNGDPVWNHVLKTIKFFDLCFLPSYNANQLDALEHANEEFNRGLKEIFGETFKHKSHLSTHYKELSEEYGPLRHIRTIRFEGKHREMKNYAKNTNSRRNLSFSCLKKWQYSFALRLLKNEGLDDRISIHDHNIDSVTKKMYFPKIAVSNALNEVMQRPCFFTNELTVNGIVFSPELWLPIFEDGGLIKINEVIEVLLLDLKDTSKMFVVCRAYTATYNSHFESYNVDIRFPDDKLSLINIKSYMDGQHQYPVKIHDINNEHLFRCKRF